MFCVTSLIDYMRGCLIIKYSHAVDDYKLGPMGSTSVIGIKLISGSEEVKCFTFETIDNNKTEYMRSVQLELQSLNDLVTVGQKTVLVQIVDNDGRSHVQEPLPLIRDGLFVCWAKEMINNAQCLHCWQLYWNF